MSLVTFATYVYSSDDHVLTAEKAFVCLSLFDIIRLPLALLPLLIVYMVEVPQRINFVISTLTDDDTLQITYNSTLLLLFKFRTYFRHFLQIKNAEPLFERVFLKTSL